MRLAAARGFLAFHRGGAFPAAPPEHLRHPNQRGLYVNLLRGMVRHQRLLLAEVERLASKPIAKLDEVPVVLVMLGLFQLRFTDGAEHAAIFETVALAESMGFRHAKGWINALLRSAQREGQKEEDTVGEVSPALQSSHPDWMVARWVAHFGVKKSEAICRANNRFEGAALRPETRRISQEDLLSRLEDENITTQPHPLLKDALWVERLGPLLASQVFREGWCYVQDVSSQLAMLWLRSALTGQVLDVCAAPGGKLTHLQGLIPKEAKGVRPPKHIPHLMGADRSLGRLNQVRENIARLRQPHVPLFVADGAHLPFANAARHKGWDAILLDAPCSATGMIRKYPELKWRKHEDDLPRFAETQRALLEESARVLRTGGRLVYITCSLEPEENQDAVNAFLETHPNFKRRSLMTLPVPLGLNKKPESLLTSEGDLQLLPSETYMGLYAALLVKS